MPFRPRAICPVCHREAAISTNYTITKHGFAYQESSTPLKADEQVGGCGGSGRPVSPEQLAGDLDSRITTLIAQVDFYETRLKEMREHLRLLEAQRASADSGNSSGGVESSIPA